METRNRVNRGRNVSSSSSQALPQRTSRQTAATAKKPPARETRQRSAQSTATEVKPGKFNQAPAARRGAPRSTREGSADTLATVPTRVDSESEEEAVPASFPPGNAIVEDSEDSLEGSEPESVEEEVDQATRQLIMAECLPSLSSTSQDLVTSLVNPNHESAMFRRLWKIKQKAFSLVRDEYHQPDQPSFLIDWALTGGELSEVSDFSAQNAGNILARANLATLINALEVIRSDDDVSPYELLEDIEDVFPKVFSTVEPTERDLLMTLDIRTNYLIGILETKEGDKLVYSDTITDIFCDSAQADSQDAATLFTHGPFRSLGGPDEEAEVDLCAERITKIISLVRGKKPKSQKIADMKEAFPLNNLLSDLRNWVLDMNDTLSRPAPEGEEFHDAAEQPVAESVSGSLAESQPIQRLPLHREPSLFVSAESLEALEQRNTAPPSGQRQVEPPQGTPRDYIEHSDEGLLLGAAFSQSAHLAAKDRTERRYRGPFVPDDEDDEEDAFEVDVRPVDNSKRAAIEAALPNSKRQRPDDSEEQRPRPASTAPPSSARDAMPPPPPPASQMMRDKKAMMAARARASVPESYKQRHAWSEEDCDLLVELVHNKHASWAAIHREEGHRFELPRNQQAYRDKARNMKVDFLLTDRVLPPCFDLVALGPKEISKVLGFGKNPYRKENEVLENGRPFNTEYADPA